MTKRLHGVVFALSADDEYDDMAHVWVRDAETADWFSLSRGVDSDVIEVVASDQRNRASDDFSVTLFPTRLMIRMGHSLANALAGHLEYVIEFHPESEDISCIRDALEVIFRGKPGLQVCV